jgi:hypothetical protein
MKNTHTPAPWKIEPHDHANVIWADNGTICDVFHANENDDMTSGFPVMQESEANARLIAAAPELLEALQELLCDKYLSAPLNADRMAKAREAVKKATN